MKPLILIVAVAALLYVLFVSLAWSQSFYLAPEGGGHPMPGQNHWYDRECCDNRHCEPIPEAAISMTPSGLWQVRYLNMYGLLIEAEVPPARVKPSKDGQFHACSTSAGTFLCLYIPMQF